MIIPKKLKVGGHIFDVVIEKMDCMGSCNSTDNIINISKDAVQSQKEATLMHEIFHAINTTFSGGHNFSHALLDSLAEQFYQVLRDNKLLDPRVAKEKKKKRKK